MASKGKVKITVTYPHWLNFGSADEPDYKTLGDVVEVGKEQAELLVKTGHAEYTVQEKTEQAEQAASGEDK